MSVLDDVGQDEVVVKYFGEPITYAMIKKCKSPNPLTFDGGGWRTGGGRKKKSSSAPLEPKLGREAKPASVVDQRGAGLMDNEDLLALCEEYSGEEDDLFYDFEDSDD